MSAATALKGPVREAMQRPLRASLRVWGDEDPKLIEMNKWSGEVGNARHPTRREVVRIPVDALVGLPGVRGERRVFHRDPQTQVERFGNYALPRWERFLDELCRDGMEEPITITVSPGEGPKVFEGNHRIQGAAQREWKTVCAEVTYYGHSERQFTGESFYGQVMAFRPPVRMMPKQCDHWLLSRQDLLDRGAGGHLGQALMRYIRLDKIEGLPPIPEASNGVAYEWGRHIVDPIEVTYVAADDRYYVYAGQQRLTQARINDQSYILAFVEPDQGRIGANAAAVQPRGAYPRLPVVGPWNDFHIRSAQVQQRRVERHVESYLMTDDSDADARADWRRSIAGDCEAFSEYRRELIRRWPHVAREVGALGGGVDRSAEIVGKLASDALGKTVGEPGPQQECGPQP